MQSPQTERIKERIKMPDVLAMYGLTLNRHDECCCPFHNEKTPSFGVFADGNAWHCFGCGAGGDVITFVQKMEGITFREAMRLLMQRYGIEAGGPVDTVAARAMAAKRAKEQKELEEYRAEYNRRMHVRQKCEMDLKRYAPRPGDQSMDARYLEAMQTLESEYIWLEKHPWR